MQVRESEKNESLVPMMISTIWNQYWFYTSKANKIATALYSVMSEPTFRHRYYTLTECVISMVQAFNNTQAVSVYMDSKSVTYFDIENSSKYIH